MAANNLCLSKIVHTIPTHQLHLIKSAIYAKQAWESLRSVYQPRNSLHASTLKSDIITYRCQPSMNIACWLNNMQRLYNTLCGTDTDCMMDRHFALAILNNMPQNGTWRNFLSGLRNKVHEHDSCGTPISSIDFIISIHKEFWFCHHDKPQNNTLVFSARSEADKRGVKRNCAVGQGESTPTNKHVCNTDKNCSNTHCGAPRGHFFEDCIAYGGGSQGKYTEWWKGLWNIHLPLEQQNRANNVPPTNHPASRNNNSMAQKAMVFYMHDGTTSRSQSSHNLSTTDDGPHVCTITAAEGFSDL